MIWKIFAAKWPLLRRALLPLVVTLTAVSLTACSTLLEDMTAANAALPPAVVANNAAVANPAPLPAPKLPEVPPHLVKCVEAAPKTPPTKSGKATANEKVAALKLTADERKECARAILAWYKRLQAAEAAGKAKKG